MRVLFISRELGASELALKLKQEGNEVRLYIQEESLRDCLDGLVEKTEDWEKEKEWVGKEGLIIFDDVGFGKYQTNLRKEGYRVVGGCKEGDRMEEDRLIGKKVLEEAGLKTLPSYTFSDPGSAINFIQKNKDDIWVVKVNGGHVSSLCYVGVRQDQSDVLAVLEHYQKMGVTTLNLQKRVEGVEIGVGRYFNGNDWVGPIEINVEHKALMPGDIGPKTAEMGTVMWYDSNENNRLFQSTLAKLKEYLQNIDFHGDVDVNCIVNGDDIWPLELTARFGNPSTALQMELHLSPWEEFLSAVADGKSCDLQYQKGFGVTVTLAVPPFPYYMKTNDAEASFGLPVTFAEPITPDQIQHYAFEEVRLASYGGYEVGGCRGCVMHVSGHGETIGLAREDAYRRVRNVQIPKVFYRDDIGLYFEKTELSKLKEWDWL